MKIDLLAKSKFNSIEAITLKAMKDSNISQKIIYLLLVK